MNTAFHTGTLTQANRAPLTNASNQRPAQMSDQDHAKLVSDAAEAFAVNSNKCGAAKFHAFLAGVAFAQANPEPRVMALIDLAEKIVDGCYSKAGNKSVEIVDARIEFYQKLAAFKERK
jgi:hypothetical protein